jgi:cell division protein WhiA
VTTAERDLVAAIRDELAAIDPPRRCCRAAETAGLAGAWMARRPAVERVALRVSRGLSATPALGGTGVAIAALPASGGPGAADFDWDRAADHCRQAWLRGRFLAHGSLSLSSGRTHMEFLLSPQEAAELSERLRQVEIESSWRVRRGRGVVTWKSGESVGTFLRLAGADSALLELEARHVARSVRGDLNRVINAESANLQRAVEAAARQLEAIDTVDADGRLARQPDVVRIVAAARREEPEATLSELAERTGLHRAAVQRALERVEFLALHPGGGTGRRGRSRAD